MSESIGLSSGEIVVLSGLLAMTALAVVSTFGFTLAYLITREPARPATAASPAVPRAAAAVRGPVDFGRATGRPRVAAG